jgi:hypothetical protein
MQPIALTDSQMSAVLAASHPLPPDALSAFLADVAVRTARGRRRRAPPDHHGRATAAFRSAERQRRGLGRRAGASETGRVFRIGAPRFRGVTSAPSALDRPVGKYGRG